MLSGLWKWSRVEREDGEKRKTCQLPSPFGHSLRFAKHFRAIYLVDSDSFADANISIANFFSACTSYNSSINQSAVKWCFHKNNNTKPRPRTPLRKRKMKRRGIFPSSFFFCFYNPLNNFLAGVSEAATEWNGKRESKNIF